jgi:NADH dehydrogenase (ubiquinone) 1 alpha/beta subcomplex 1
MKTNNALRTAQYSSAGGLSKEEVEARVLDVFKGFEKVNQNKVSKYVELTVGRTVHC